MKVNIKTRDGKFFLLGIVVAFTISAIYSWEDSVQSFKKGASMGQDFFGKSD